MFIVRCEVGAMTPALQGGGGVQATADRGGSPLLLVLRQGAGERARTHLCLVPTICTPELCPQYYMQLSCHTGLAHPAQWPYGLQALWADKVYLPAAIREEPRRMRAYAASLTDAHRTRITEEELCAFTWLFTFKPEAGPFWRILCGNGPLKCDL